MHSTGSLCHQSAYSACIPWFKRTPVQLRPADAGQAEPCRVPRRGGGFSKFLPCLRLHQGDPQGQRDRGAPRDPADRLGQLGLVDLSRPKEERGLLFKGSSIVGTSCQQLVPRREAHRREAGGSWGGSIPQVLTDLPDAPAAAPSPVLYHRTRAPPWLTLAHPGGPTLSQMGNRGSFVSSRAGFTPGQPDSGSRWAIARVSGWGI